MILGLSGHNFFRKSVAQVILYYLRAERRHRQKRYSHIQHTAYGILQASTPAALTPQVNVLVTPNAVSNLLVIPGGKVIDGRLYRKVATKLRFSHHKMFIHSTFTKLVVD